MQPRESKDFVKKLYDILEDDNNRDLIRWNDNGSSFLIINPDDFGERILKKSFRHNNISSFIRQLNKYDFHKIKCSPSIIGKYGLQVIEFEHMYFQKGKRNQLYKIKRKSSSLEPASIVSDLLPSVESHSIFQNHVVSTINDLSDKFNIIIDNINDLKSKLKDLSEYQDRFVSVLIYDEDPNMAIQIYTLLKDRRVRVLVIESKVCLYSVLKNMSFDFMILGANVVFLKEVMRYLRGFNLLIPVIYIGFDNFEFDVFSIGVTDFIKKPFSYSDFFYVINKYIPRKIGSFI